METTQKHLTHLKHKASLGPWRLRISLADHKLLTIGLMMLLIMFSVAVFAPQIVQLDPYEINPMDRLTGPSAQYWFGTDEFGRDVFSRSVYGARYSFFIGMVVAALSVIPALIIGLLSAYFPLLDLILMRVMDGLYAFPAILLAIAIVAIRGSSVENLMIALVIVYIPAVSRVIRSAALSVKGKSYIKALDSQGASAFRIIGVHMLPNILPTVFIQFSYVFAQSIMTESALSFLGAGIPAPMPSLGNILFDGKAVIYNSWWMTVFPGLFIVMLVIGLNFVGDGLSNAFNQRHVGRVKRVKAKKGAV